MASSTDDSDSGNLMSDEGDDDDDDEDVTIVQIQPVRKPLNIVTETSSSDLETECGGLDPEISVSIWEIDWLMTSLSHVFVTNMESVLLLVFDLRKDFLQVEEDVGVSTLDQIILWVNSFYHKACFNSPFPLDNKKEGPVVSSALVDVRPNIVIVGTNKGSLHPDPNHQDILVI